MLPRPRRTLDDIDHELERQSWLLERAMRRMAAESAELTMARIDELLDERLELQPAT
jgi:hypothetical protein